MSAKRQQNLDRKHLIPLRADRDVVDLDAGQFAQAVDVGACLFGQVIPAAALLGGCEPALPTLRRPA